MARTYILVHRWGALRKDLGGAVLQTDKFRFVAQASETKRPKRYTRKPPGGRSSEIWVEMMCRRSLQILTLLKTKYVHFAIPFKTGDLILLLYYFIN